MLIERSIVDVADNTGALSVRLFAVNGKNGRKSVTVGDAVMGSVQKSTPTAKVKKGDKVRIVIVTTRRKLRRKDGSAIKFSANRGVIVNKATLEMVGTRVFGPIAREIREKSDVVDNYKKIVSLAEEVL
jgi:large subunit ribosomal protein L14